MVPIDPVRRYIRLFVICCSLSLFYCTYRQKKVKTLLAHFGLILRGIETKIDFTLLCLGCSPFLCVFRKVLMWRALEKRKGVILI